MQELPIAAAAVVLAALGGSAFAQVESDKVCSTTALAANVIGRAKEPSDLVVAVAHSVPTDPRNCVSSFCDAARQKPKTIQVAIGAGISEALATLLAKGRDAEATIVLARSCDGCPDTILAAIAASQGTIKTSLCETNAGEGQGNGPPPGGGGGPPGGGGGGRPPSPN